MQRFLTNTIIKNVKQSFRHILFAVSFLMLFVGYQICITSFTHVHYVNGVLISHSHPFANDDHSHQKTEFIFIAHLSDFTALPLAAFESFDFLSLLLAVLDICQVEEIPFLASIPYFHLRAPPVAQ